MENKRHLATFGKNEINYDVWIKKKQNNQDFPGDPVVENPPANAGDTGSIPGPGRFHMLHSN